jgi:chemotaxis protein methyltransferase CheR
MAFTFLFRDLHTLELAVQHAVPSFLGRRRARVWDAGCATGQEVYSLAILLAEKMTPFGLRNLRIEASDIDETGQFGGIVREASYSNAEVERIPCELRQKYFEPAGEERKRVTEAVRELVHFRQHDLLSLEPIGEGFSLIVCKNVLLHFSQQQRVEVIRMFHRALEPGGYLVMEQTQKLPPEMEILFQQAVPDAQLFAKSSEIHTAQHACVKAEKKEEEPLQC